MTQSIYDAKQTLEAFLTAAAAKQATPGGGSVTALVGALSAAMGEMVLNYSVGKKDLAQHEPELREVLAEFGRARQLLLALMSEDQAAYDALSQIRKEGGAADDRFPAALLACVRVPQAIATTAVAILELCERVGDRINPHLASDLAVCAELAMATTRCAIYNVRVNLADITDAGERRRFETNNARTWSAATSLIQRVLPRIWRNIDKG
jgi:glutamate formiminotransferase/formiminotetrahydrofolate cyclodeaminase